MSNPIPPIAAPTGEFQGQINGPPNTSDPAAACKQCAGLLAERQKLREELAKVREERDRFYRALMRLECENYVPPYTKEELFAHAIYEPPIEELLAELDKDSEDRP